MGEASMLGESGKLADGLSTVRCEGSPDLPIPSLIQEKKLISLCSRQIRREWLVVPFSHPSDAGATGQ